MRELTKGLSAIAIATAVSIFFAFPAAAQTEVAISAVQGTGNISPFEGKRVQVTGIVTARIRTGFFVQSTDEAADKDPATSEGIFVFTKTEPEKDAVPGNVVSVAGKVEEFRRNNEPASLTVTEIVFESLKVHSTANALPKPVVLDLAMFRSNTVDQLERLEGMRVQAAELLVVSPTDGRVNVTRGTAESNGSFYGVLKGMPRPFREPGLEILELALLDEKARQKLRSDHPKIPVFDANPERLRIESAMQDGAAAIDVAVGVPLKDLTGVLHYTYRTNTLLVDPGYAPGKLGTPAPNEMPDPREREFSIAGMNIENFFDDRDDPSYKEDVVEPKAFQDRLNKISLAFRKLMKMPAVVGINEAESIEGLRALAAKINADTVAAGQPDPGYEAFLEPGNDGRGIDNGFLVRTKLVKVIELKQLGKDVTYKNPGTKESVPLNDRPPLMLRAEVADTKTGKPFEFTVIVNHMKSFSGYNDQRQSENVRLKKRLQAEYLARLVQQRQTADPAAMIIVLGDMNFYQFNDGIMDPVGTIKGTPAGKDATVNASDDLVDPDLINMVDLIDTGERYSYIFDGNAQVLDHVLITKTLGQHVRGFGYLRVNADYPETFRNDAARPERFSDHDPAVIYISLDERR